MLASRGRAVAIAAAVVVLVAVGVGVWSVVHRGGGAAASGRACPGSQQAAPDGLPVPARPTAAIPADALVPDRGPDSVLLCEYQDAGVPDPDADPTDVEVRLSRSADVGGADAAVTLLVAQLRSAPRSPDSDDAYCFEAFSLGAAPSLVALRYPDGVVWVATPGTCGDGSTNGVDGSPLDVSADITAALDRTAGRPAPTVSGSQPADPPFTTAVVPRVPSWDEPCGTDAEPPDAVDLLPWRPVSVTVCHRAAGSPATVPSPVGAEHPEPVAAALAGQLAALSEDGAYDGCSDDRAAEMWLLLFTNAAGDQLSVTVENGSCPTVTNGQTNRVADAALLARLAELDPA